MTSLDEVKAHGGDLVTLTRCIQADNPDASEAVAMALSQRFGAVVIERDRLLGVLSAVVDALRISGLTALAAEVEIAAGVPRQGV